MKAIMFCALRPALATTLVTDKPVFDLLCSEAWTQMGADEVGQKAFEAKNRLDHSQTVIALGERIFGHSVAARHRKGRASRCATLLARAQGQQSPYLLR